MSVIDTSSDNRSSIIQSFPIEKRNLKYFSNLPLALKTSPHVAKCEVLIEQAGRLKSFLPSSIRLCIRKDVLSQIKPADLDPPAAQLPGPAAAPPSCLPCRKETYSDPPGRSRTLLPARAASRGQRPARRRSHALTAQVLCRLWVGRRRWLCI